MKKSILFFVFFLVCVSGKNLAQDFHVAQYDVASLYVNPATTGMYDFEKTDYKVYAITRSQWRSLGIKPFFTTFLAYDRPYKLKGKKIGLGGYFINNRTGPTNFNTTEFMLSGAYDIFNTNSKNVNNQSANSKHYLTTGLQLGVFYKSLNLNNLTYDVQYSPFMSGGNFDQSIASGENNNASSIVRFNANYGIYYKYIARGQKYHPFAGFSMAHLNQANESFTGTVNRIPIKFSFNGGCEIKIDNKIDITPRFLYMNQAKSNEINFGFLGYYKLPDNKTQLLVGANYRHKDAIIIHTGVKHDVYFLRFSYDINNSILRNYTNGRGAWEISLIFYGEKGVTFKKLRSSF